MASPVTNGFIFPNQSTIATPGAGITALFAKNGKLYQKDSAGVETQLITSNGGYNYGIYNASGTYTLLDMSSQSTILTSTTDIGVLITRFFTDFASKGGSLYIASHQGTGYLQTTTVNIPQVANTLLANRNWIIRFDSVKILGALNLTLFTIGDFVKFDLLGSVEMDIQGSGQAFNILATTVAQRSLYESRWERLRISCEQGNSTTYAMTLGNNLRCTFDHIEIKDTLNGIRFVAQHAGFNPGDSVFNRMFVELGFSANGIAYDFDSLVASFTCSYNQSQFNVIEGFANGATATFIRMRGQPGFTGAQWNRFFAINAEQFVTIFDIQVGLQNHFYGNAIVGRSGVATTFIKTGIEALANSFELDNIVPQTATNDIIINDLNTDRKRPTIIRNTNIGFGPVTRTAYINTVTSATTIININDMDGPGVYALTNPINRTEFFTDFLQNATTNTPFSEYSATLIGTGTITNPTGIAQANHPGIIRIASSAIISTGARIGTNPDAINIGGGEEFEMVFILVAFGTLTGRYGFIDSLTNADNVDGVYFETASTGVTTLKTSNNSVRTTSATVATLATGIWYKAKIQVFSPTRAVATLYNSATDAVLGTQTITTNIPIAGTRQTGAGVNFTNGAAAAVNMIDIDYMRTTIGTNRNIIR
jgi:hypothetical protein